MTDPNKNIDAVFEGGGVKGSALVGAVAKTEELGYRFENLAGTSAGAIVAALLAAGYSAKELGGFIQELDYRKFKDPTMLTTFPIGGQALSLFINKGIYAGDYLENWLRDLLAAKNIRTFKDLIIPKYQDDIRYRYRLQVIASDISRGRLLMLPRDIQEYGINPDDLDVAWAVRMSMSIPYFYKPVILKMPNEKIYVVDGGILSNFPVWIFDDGSPDPIWPTIGYKLVDPDEEKPHNIGGPITLFKALFETMMEAHDARYIKDSNFMRTIPIPTLGVSTTDFEITKDKKQKLYNAGLEAAQKFFEKWDFEEYKAKFRKKEEESRTKRVWGEEK